MPTRRMRTIAASAPGARNVLEPATVAGLPLVVGGGGVIAQCGRCGLSLMDAPFDRRSAIDDHGTALVRCPQCRAYNELPQPADFLA